MLNKNAINESKRDRIDKFIKDLCLKKPQNDVNVQTLSFSNSFYKKQHLYKLPEETKIYLVFSGAFFVPFSKGLLVCSDGIYSIDNKKTFYALDWHGFCKAIFLAKDNYFFINEHAYCLAKQSQKYMLDFLSELQNGIRAIFSDLYCKTDKAKRKSLVQMYQEFPKLLNYLDEQLTKRNCNHTFEITREFFKSNNILPNAALEWLKEHGVGCDCEVLSNVEKYFDTDRGRMQTIQAGVIISINDQLDILSDLGIRPTHDDFYEWFENEWDKEDIESDSYNLLLLSLGGEREKENDKWESLSDDVYAFDTECVEDDNIYQEVFMRLATLSKGVFNISQVSSSVNHDKEESTVSFNLNGQKYHWNLKYDDDWFDCEVVSKINSLLKDNGSTKFFFTCTYDQNLIVVFTSKDVVEKLNNLVTLPFVLAACNIK